MKGRGPADSKGVEFAHQAAAARPSPTRAGRRDRQRGVAIVEAAFATIVFFSLILGVIEIGLAMNDNLALASSVRAGSRVLSASGNDRRADLYTVLNVARESSALDRRNIEYVVVYKPASFGQEPSTACKGGSSVTDVCNVYRLADLDKAQIQVTEETEALAEERTVDPSKVFFGCTTLDSLDHAWCPNLRKVTQTGTGPDYVGVWMKIRHPWVTKMFGNEVTLTDSSVVRLEPRQA